MPDKSFTPHLTLGRVRGDSPKGDLATIGRAVLQTAAPQSPGPFLVSSVTLMKSELRPGGSIYTRTGHFELR